VQGFAFFGDENMRFKFASFFMGAIAKWLLIAQATGAIGVLLTFYNVYMTRFGLSNDRFTHLISSLMRLLKMKFIGGTLVEHLACYKTIYDGEINLAEIVQCRR
jgi:hypothetical protein